MKYLLINKSTGQQTLCDKVTRWGFDYYVSDDFLRIGDYGYWNDADVISQINDLTAVLFETKKVIATNNPNIDIPKVVTEVEKFIQSFGTPENEFHTSYIEGFREGYNKAQEIHPFSEKDMIELIEWMQTPAYLLNIIDSSSIKTTKELLQLWKSQQPTKVYYQ